MQQTVSEVDELEVSSGGGLKIKPYLRIVQRNIVLIAIGGAVCGAAGFFKMMTEPPVYKAAFQMLMEPVTAEARLTDPSNLARNQQDTRAPQFDYGTQLAILQGRGIAQDIVEVVQEDFPWFNRGFLNAGLEIEEVKGTKILSIAYSGSDPALVESVSIATAQRYLQYSLDERRNRITEGVRFIEEQLPDLRARVNSLQQEIENLQQDNDLIDPQQESGILAGQFRDVVAQQMETQRQILEQQTLYRNLQQQLNLSPDAAIASTALSEDPGYQAILGELQTINTLIAQESARFSEESPAIQALRERQDNLTALLQSESQRVIGPELSGLASDPQVIAFQNSIRRGLTEQLVATTNQIEMLETRNSDLLASQQEMEAELRGLPSVIRRYTELNRELEIATRTLDQLLNQRETLKLAVAQSEFPWEILEWPWVPRDEDNQPVPLPPDSKDVLAGIMAGLILGAGAGLALEKLRDVYFQYEDVEDGLDAPLIAKVPKFHKVPTQGLVNLSMLAERSIQAQLRGIQFLESFGELFVSLRHMNDDVPVRSVAIASPMSGDGKTTIATHLAQSIANMGQRALLVDANLRFPSVHDRLQIPNEKGLSELLSDGLESTDVIQRAGVSKRLAVITAGQVTASTPRLLASNRMKQLASQFDAEFDFVIYDTSQAVGLMDVKFLAPYLDGAIVVINRRKTKVSRTQTLLEEFEKYGIPVLGTVVNRVPPGRLQMPTYGGLDTDIDEGEEDEPDYFETDYEVVNGLGAEEETEEEEKEMQRR